MKLGSMSLGECVEGFEGRSGRVWEERVVYKRALRGRNGSGFVRDQFCSQVVDIGCLVCWSTVEMVGAWQGRGKSW